MRLPSFVREWVLPLLVLGFLYVSGLHRPLISLLQRGMLLTGIFDADENERMLGPQVLVDLHLRDEAGTVVAREDLQGKTLLLNFWASWCAPCLAEMPDLASMQARYAADPNREVMLISVDREFEKAIRLRDKKGYTFPIYRADAIPEALRSRSIPATFVIDPQGRLRFEKRGIGRYDTEDFRAFFEGLRE
jgi:thiol-disulfide isomerase/thioredoxin